MSRAALVTARNDFQQRKALFAGKFRGNYGNLVLRVQNNGRDLKSKKINENGGIGLGNTRARLENLYDAAV